MRGLVNLLIVILIAYTLNAVPINTSLLSFDLLKPWDKLTHTEETTEDAVTPSFPVITLVQAKQERYNNPTTLLVEFSSDAELTKEQFQQLKNSTNISITGAEGIQDASLSAYELDNSSITSSLLNTSEDQKWFYQLSLDVSSNKTGLSIGLYPLVITMFDQELDIDTSANYELVYAPELAYAPAINQANEDQFYTQVYYLNETKEFLIPVTKKLSSSSKFIRNTIASLSYEPPNNERIFSQDSVFPKMPRVYLSNGTLSCYLAGSEIKQFEEGSSESKLLSEAIVKTLTAIPYIDNLAFYVNDRQQGNFINGLPLTRIYNEDYKVYAYVNYYDNIGTSYLVPKLVNGEQTTVEDIFDVLTRTHQKIGKYGLLTASVPSTVSLLEVTSEDDTLKLEFSDNLASVYQSNEPLQALMMNSIVQSFTSLSSVNQVIITTKTMKDGSIGNVQLGTKLSSNSFLNPIH